MPQSLLRSCGETFLVTLTTRSLCFYLSFSVQEYSRSCIVKSETETISDADGSLHKVCEKYNPYFTEQLYVNDIYKSWWSDQFTVENPAAAVAKFDADRYK